MEFKSVRGCLVPEGQGKRSGIFVDVTGKTNKEKAEIFDLVEEEIGEEIHRLDYCEITRL